ncbi:helix-turn-helix protein [Streptomyces sp. T12]|uniref:helix-turn-helix domain-containing protein n=1 Tax=Streptomyces sp. T12 TaxID=477697 RepID=UPI00119F2143|nr:helix-turn-helix transcriptional regulator [Streptomyces sp. T12]TWD25281.1 helix-turn-helix protein [Streptomyces sp. T12]
MTAHQPNHARVIPLRRGPAPSGPAPSGPTAARPSDPQAAPREPLWRHLVGDVLRKERQVQERTLKDVADAARISMPYLSEVERGRKEASSEVLAAAAGALGLGLGDLLARTHAELVRVTSRRTPVATRPVVRDGSANKGLCLAA